VYVHTVKEDSMREGLLFAGTERGAYLSFDGGDNWQPLQLNLPVTSVRDFEIHGDDLVVGTHGRGIWIIDDISPLRQITDAVLRADAHLFKPADAINYIRGGDNGTPLQKDEPQAQNAPDGAAIDYYLKAAASVTLEILDAGGNVVQTYTSGEAPSPAGGGRGGRGGIPNTSPLWRTAPEAFAGSAGMHRVVWAPGGGGGRGFGGGGGGRGAAAAIAGAVTGGGAPGTAGAAGAAGGRGRAGGGGGATGGGRGGRGGGGGETIGTFTAKLTVNGQSYSQTFTIRPDPRSADR
jgi:hypothetical protein